MPPEQESEMAAPNEYSVGHILSPDRYNRKLSYQETVGTLVPRPEMIRDHTHEHTVGMMQPLGYGQRYVPTAGFKRRSRSELSLEWSCIEPGCGRRYEQWRRFVSQPHVTVSPADVLV
jgi:hypothetical protein